MSIHHGACSKHNHDLYNNLSIEGHIPRLFSEYFHKVNMGCIHIVFWWWAVLSSAFKPCLWLCCVQGRTQ